MPPKIYFAALLLWLTTCCTVSASAQNFIIDSLQQSLRTATKNERPVLMAEIARAHFEKDLNLALKLGQEALTLATTNNNSGAKAFAYATIGHLLVQKKQERLAASYIDSALTAAKHSKDPTLTAFVYFRKGWFELVSGNDEKAMSWLLKSEKVIEQVDNHRTLNTKTLTNHYISSIYAYGNDTLKQQRYAKICFDAAHRSGSPDDLQMGYMTMAHSYFSTFEHDKSNRHLLKVSMDYFQKAMRIYEEKQEKILIQSNGSVTALNIANSYFKYYPPSYRDSAIKFVNTALGIARKCHTREVIANCYGILSEYALRAKQFDVATGYLQTGIAELAEMYPGADMTRSRLMLALAHVAEESGNTEKALEYYKQYSSYYEKVFDVQKLTITQRLEEEFHARQRENEITLLKQRADFNKRLNWLYVAVGSAGIISLALLLSFYHYRLKASQQEKKLSEQEKEEAKLQALLKQAEAKQLALEKQEVELQASLREEESAKLLAEQKLLQDRTEWLEKELLAGTLKIEEKNAIFGILKEKARDADSPIISKQIDRIINQNLHLDKNVDEQQSLSHIHPGFFSALQDQAANCLTQLDLKYCAYILMGLDTKDIASRLAIEPKSIRMARYRIKQKLKLGKDENLDQMIRSFGQRSS